MRLTKKHKEIIAYALALNVEEMPEGEVKQLTIEILGNFQQKGIWGNIGNEVWNQNDDEY